MEYLVLQYINDNKLVPDIGTGMFEMKDFSTTLAFESMHTF